MLGRQEPGAEVSLLVVGQAARIRQDDKRRQIVGQIAQGIRNPRAEAGKSGQHEPGVHHVTGRAVYVRLGRHRHQERELVDDRRLVGKHGTDPASRFTMLSELERTLHHGPCRRGEALGFLLRPEHLPVQPGQFRLVIKRVHGTGAAVHEQLDDPFHLGRMMKATVQCGLRWLERRGFRRQQVRERQGSEATTGMLQKVASRQCWLEHR